MTLQGRIHELVAEKIGEWVSPYPPTAEELRAFADTILEEVEKVALAEKEKCLAWKASSDDKHKSHGWAMSALTADILASAIRSGKGK